VRATGDIGGFTIVSEAAVAAGVRRIVAYTGEAAERHLREIGKRDAGVRHLLGAAPEEVLPRLEALLEERKRLERDLKALKRESLSGGADDLLQQARPVEGVNVLAARVEAESVDDLRALADSLRGKLRSGIAVLGAVIAGKGTLLCAVTDDLVKAGVKAGDIVNPIAALADGRGGGPPHMATAGAKDAAKLPLAIERAPELIGAYLAQRKAKG
jgi:alanyl-tRNA synthetase